MIERTLSQTVAWLCIGAFILLIVSLGMVTPPTFPHSIVLATEPLPILPPHQHGLGAAESDSGHGQYVSSQVYVVPDDVVVTGMAMSMHNAPSDILLHHLGVYTNIPGNSAIAGFARDTHFKQFEFPAPYGVFLPKGTKLFLRAMLHNPEPPEGPGATYRDVSVEVRLRLAENPTRRDHHLLFHLLALGYPEEPGPETIDTFTVPSATREYAASPVNTKSLHGVFTFPTDATVLGMGAHMHGWDGGREVTLYQNGSPIANYEAHASALSPWTWQSDGDEVVREVRAGDTFSLTALYDNNEPVPLRGAMGELGFYYYPIP